MNELSNVMAKLSGIRKALVSALNENVSRNRSGGEVKTRANFTPDHVEHYFKQAEKHIEALRKLLPDLFSDFQKIKTEPETEMVPTDSGQFVPWNFSRAQLEKLVRDIDQIFEIRANSELEQPKQATLGRVFISHGRSDDWRRVQPFIERGVHLGTIELEHQPNSGRTIIEKLIDTANLCDSAVIIMTGDDIANLDESRVRENVMHEIGFFQGKYGRKFVILLHEEGVNVPTNLSGVAYVPFPKGTIEASFHVIQRELKTIYNL